MLSESSNRGYRARPAKDLLASPCLVARPAKSRHYRFNVKQILHGVAQIMVFR